MCRDAIAVPIAGRLIPWIVICCGAFLIGLTKSGLGAGLALIVTPIAAIALGHTERGSAAALGLMMPLLLFGDIFSVYQYRRLYDWRLIRSLVVPGLVGIALGSGLLWLIHAQDAALVGALVRLEIGLESTILVGLYWWRQSRGDADDRALMREPLRAWLAGTYTGVSTTLAHAAGPVVAMYLLPLKPDRRAFVGSSAVLFAIFNACKLPGYALAGQFAHAEFGFTARFLPFVVLGALVGFRLNARLSNLGFLRFVYGATFAIGAYLLVDGAVLLIAR